MNKQELLELLLKPVKELSKNDRRRYHLNSLLRIRRRRRSNRQNHEIKVLQQRLGMAEEGEDG